MDTREKIVDAALVRGRRATLVTGYFDPMLDWHAERIGALRDGATAVAAVILPLEGELLTQRARAELVAALRVIDYVLIAPGPDRNAAEDFIRALEPAQVIRLDEDDLRCRSELIADVRSRPTR
jgi:hypothetical protein